MKIYRILVPHLDNEAKPLTTERTLFEANVSVVFGGWTRGPKVTGSWGNLNPQIEEMHPYEVATNDQDAVRKLLRIAELSFPDQKAFYIGNGVSANVYNTALGYELTRLEPDHNA